MTSVMLHIKLNIKSGFFESGCGIINNVVGGRRKVEWENSPPFFSHYIILP